MFFPHLISNLKSGAIALLALSVQESLCRAQTAPSAPEVTHPDEAQITVSKPLGDARPQENGAATTTSFAGSSFGAVNGDYVFKPGDSIEMVVYREPDLNIGGLSVRSATSLIRQKYNSDFVVEPQVYLNVVAYNSRKFTIIGQVGRPGTYEFGGSESLDLLEAIGMSGGFTRIADRGHVVVKRREGNAMRVLKVNAKKLSDDGIDRFEIHPGDVINVAESWY